MSKQIEVWHDETGDPGNPLWCVSLCDDDGQEIELLSAHADKAPALDAGEDAARRLGLRLCERSKYGPITEIASAGEL